MWPDLPEGCVIGVRGGASEAPQVVRATGKAERSALGNQATHSISVSRVLCASHCHLLKNQFPGMCFEAEKKEFGTH